jgi:hypothetical protein
VFRPASHILLHVSPQLAFRYSQVRSDAFETSTFGVGVGGTAAVGVVF